MKEVAPRDFGVRTIKVKEYALGKGFLARKLSAAQ